MKNKNTYWNGNGKHQATYDECCKWLPKSGKSNDVALEALRVASNAYYDYFNNGGGNRYLRLKPMLDTLKFKRGSAGSKALSRLKSFSVESEACMPKNLADVYEVILDSVLEMYFYNVRLDESAAERPPARPPAQMNTCWTPISSLTDSIQFSFTSV